MCEFLLLTFWIYSSFEIVKVHCVLEVQERLKMEDLKKKNEMKDRRKPLSCPIVRCFYTRSGGVPNNRLVQRAPTSLFESMKLTAFNEFLCPLLPGIYHTLPRSWCHNWRRYLKNKEAPWPSAPDPGASLCDGHQLPLVPPHLERFLNGEAQALLDVANNESTIREEVRTLQLESPRPAAVVGRTMSSPEAIRADINAQLDRENKVVVEILTDEEFTALERWWPEFHSSYALKFAVSETESGSSEIVWSTLPCRECDPSSRVDDICVRNRCRSWASKKKIL